ncbi:MAG: glycoside hydrolase family 3 protein [Streptosporangiaceae bacterium]
MVDHTGDPQRAEGIWADEAMARLSTEQKAALLYGAGPWQVRPPEPLRLHDLVMTDGPNGARGVTFHTELGLCFPCETALAATWDPDLVREVAAAMGAEARSKGASVLLAPAVNLHRNPLAGRNFECFSEDPELSAQMTAAYVAGVQSQAVACCVKHLVCNDQESARHTVSSKVGDAALRELYLAPFEAAVRVGAWSIMAAYNKLNGEYVTEHPWLLTTLLRDEWAWDGVVVSDWYATQSTAKALTAGLDLEMPGPSQLRGDKLLKALEAGELGIEDIDRSARRVLHLLHRTQQTGKTAPPSDPSGLIREAGARGIVLLKNDGVLPLAVTPGTVVAVIGSGADAGQPQGGGSCQVNPPHVADPLSAIKARLAPDATVRFARGWADQTRPRPLTAPDVTIEYRRRGAPDSEVLATEHAVSLSLSWLTPVLPGYESGELAIRVRARIIPTKTGAHQLTLAAIGHGVLALDGEVLLDQRFPGGRGVIFDLGRITQRADIFLEAGRPADLVIDYEPRPESSLLRLQAGLIPPAPDPAAAVWLATVADLAIVVAEHPHGVETEGHDRPHLGFDPEQDRLISEVCAANPRTVVVVNTGGPVAMPWQDQAAAIVQLWYPGQELGESLADVLTGAVNPSGKLPLTFPVRAQDAPSWPYYPGTEEEVRYGEGLAMGYRGHTAPPLFPFGFGLSYAAFRLGEASVQTTAAGYTVTVPVTNISDRDGREVVQLYARLADDRPFLELKAFASVHVPAGQTVPAVLTVPASGLRTWSSAGWNYLSGPVQARIGTSSADLPVTVLLGA